MSSVDVVTDRTGSFVVHGVASAAAVVPTVTGYQVRAPISLDTHAPIHNLVLDVAPLAVVRGRVVRDGAPVPGRIDQSLVGTSVQTSPDARGEFEPRGTRATGTYQLFGVGESVGAFTSPPTTVTVPTDAAVVIELNSGATIDGVVVDQDGAPVVGAQVDAIHVHDDDHDEATTTRRRAIPDQSARRRRICAVGAGLFEGSQRSLAWVGRLQIQSCFTTDIRMPGR